MDDRQLTGTKTGSEPPFVILEVTLASSEIAGHACGVVLGQQSWRPGSCRQVPNGGWGGRKVGHGEAGHAGETQTQGTAFCLHSLGMF